MTINDFKMLTYERSTAAKARKANPISNPDPNPYPNPYPNPKKPNPQTKSQPNSNTPTQDNKPYPGYNMREVQPPKRAKLTPN